jgi:hypothetical protein
VSFSECASLITGTVRTFTGFKLAHLASIWPNTDAPADDNFQLPSSRPAHGLTRATYSTMHGTYTLVKPIVAVGASGTATLPGGASIERSCESDASVVRILVELACAMSVELNNDVVNVTFTRILRVNFGRSSA